MRTFKWLGVGVAIAGVLGGAGCGSGDASATNGALTAGADAGDALPSMGADDASSRVTVDAGTDTGATPDGGEADGSNAPPTPPVTDYVFTMGAIDVSPGDEVYYCQQLGNPFGRAVDIVSVVGDHATTDIATLFDMDRTTRRTTAEKMMRCPGSGLEFHPAIYLAQLQDHAEVTFPAGTGYPVNTDHGLMIQGTYLNRGTTTLHVQATFKVRVVERSTVATHVGAFALHNTFFKVAAGVPKSLPVTIDKTLPMPIAATFLAAQPQMVPYGLAFRATSGDDVIQQTAVSTTLDWLATPVPVAAQAPIDIRCDMFNDTGRELTFGDSVINNAHCSWYGYYSPANEETPGVVQVLQ